MGDILSKIISGVALVAPTVAGFVAPGSGPLVHKLMRSVTGQPDDTPIEQVAAQIEANPALFVELQRAAMDREVRLAEIGAGELETVNNTMIEESRSEHWPQYSWRPWNGFWFAPAVVAIYFVLPVLGKPVPTVPQLVWFGWLAILGVATVGRNKEKLAKAGGGAADGILAGAIKAIRGQ